MTDKITGRPNHIMDWLVHHREGQWYGWAKGAEPRMVYANLIVHDGGSKPTEQECIDGLTQMQTEYDAQEYARKRKAEYPEIYDYIDGVVKDDQEQMDKYIADCQAVKDKYPKD